MGINYEPIINRIIFQKKYFVQKNNKIVTEIYVKSLGTKTR